MTVDGKGLHLRIRGTTYDDDNYLVELCNNKMATFHPTKRRIFLRYAAAHCTSPVGFTSMTSKSRHSQLNYFRVDAEEPFTSSSRTSPNLKFLSTRRLSTHVPKQEVAAIDFNDDELLSKFFKAAKNNDVAAAEDIIESDAFRELKESVNLTDALGNSPLMICAQRNWADSIEVLLANNYCDVNHQNIFGSSALMCSSSHGHVDALKVLISSSKVEIDLVSRFGQTALMKAAQAGKLTSIEILLDKGANASTLNKQGKNALQIAEEKEHRSVVDYLSNRLKF